MLNDSILLKHVKKSVPVVEVWNEMTIQELANSAKRDINDVLDAVYINSKENNYNENSILTIGPLLTKIVRSLGAKPQPVSKSNVKKKEKFKHILKSSSADASKLVKRHPVVTIMGHVDHGKTTLLDVLRNTSVAKSEFGGITQHIGAFDVTLKCGERATFLDTPGHAAFNSMRHRGAHVTDIVVLVVAADDGVKEQTLQSIEMAKSAKVPIIVAINKIDKPNADVNKTQSELAKHGIVVEELGGEIQCVKVSALKRINLEELIETIVLQAEIMSLKADPLSLVEGVVIECSNHVGRGKLVSALIKHGTLKKGCLLVSGLASAKVRAMFNDSGFPILEAKPSDAVQIIGWKTLPTVGDEILEVKNDKMLQEVLKARETEQSETLALEHKIAANQKHEKHLIEYRRILGIRRTFGRQCWRTAKKVLAKENEKFAEEKEKHETNVPAINIILKGDVAGSVEALLDIFNMYKSDKICRFNVVHYGIGAITNTDIELAETFNAIVYGFNVSIGKTIETDIKNKGIVVRLYKVVYKLIENIKEEINSILPKIDVEEVLGKAKVLQNIEIKDKRKKVNVAGCHCFKGVLLKSEMFHVLRNNEIIYTGKLESMRHLKEEQTSIETNLECGLRFKDTDISFQPEDIIVCFKIVSQQQSVDWDLGF
ncbi:Translation initiation factor IF-2, mitochondrial [Habropoda laboriosa]|uniref:Translation initiation factor IF-2, mitochondrial n=2 Tax=Habropoda laboriosa TaxID=597456 RepID=A0A0L7QM73_9HYME|nr:Translation initiation factor IF-2, mitochondrial [Habropoda laboriosa]